MYIGSEVAWGRETGHKFGSGSEDVMLQPLKVLEEAAEGSRGFR